MSIFKKVEQFNKEIIGITQTEICQLNAETQRWLADCLHEEAQELMDAKTTVDMIDACIDAIYFAAGGLTRMGIPAEIAELMFDVVHKANMQKQRGLKVERKTEIDLDAVKPNDWISPEGSIRRIIQDASRRKA